MCVSLREGSLRGFPQRPACQAQAARHPCEWWEECAAKNKIARPVVAHALTVLRVERPPAMDGCAGTWVGFGLNAPTAVASYIGIQTERQRSFSGSGGVSSLMI
eukprot:4052784-Prymnesium_polylepis.3